MSEHANRVYLHVGLAGSGTTCLQDALARNAAALQERDGVLVPGSSDLMLRAALDVRGNHRAWGRRRAEVAGCWDEVCHAARRHDGVTVVSQELLAATSSHRIAAAMTMLRDVEVHVVVSVRDPASQLVGEWQDGVRHGRTLRFREFTARALAGDPADDCAHRFAETQDLPRVLARWAGAVPADRVHVLCTPPAEGDPRALWRLLASAVGFDGDAYDVRDRAANASLGAVETDLLRRVNSALGGRLRQPGYDAVAKRYFAEQVLGEHVSDAPSLPPGLYDALLHVGRQWVKEIDRAGYRVHGELAHLLPVPSTEPRPHPDAVDARAELATAASALAEVLVELERARARVETLESDKRALKTKRKALKRRLAEMLAD